MRRRLCAVPYKKKKDRLTAVSPNFDDCSDYKVAPAFRFLRHNARKPPVANSNPGSPAPTMGPGTTENAMLFEMTVGGFAPTLGSKMNGKPLVMKRAKLLEVETDQNWCDVITPELIV